MSLSSNKHCTITFTNGQTREIEFEDQAIQGPFICFMLPGGGEVHVNFAGVQSIDFTAISRARIGLITQ